VAAAGARRPRTAVGELGASRRRLKKILISATLTRDPARLAGLFLHAPRMLAAASDAEAPSPERARYLLPEGLAETVVPVASGDAKPLALRALLRKTGDTPVIVFTASVEATHRLFLLLSSMDAAERKRDERDENANFFKTIFAEYSSFAPQAARAEALRAFAAGDARVLIASDAATRGLDVDRVGAVVSYDAPTHLKTYVHRVGRTARAGLGGVAYTLCRPAEEAPFLAMTSKADLRKRRAPPARLALADEEMDEHRAALRAALVAVKLHLEADAKGVAEEEERAGSTAAARVAAAQACQNYLRSRAAPS
jgi:ATP-dependent RNA helicase DDX51/DBP6